MEVYRDTSQGGSVAGFLVVGVVLVALGLGAVYFVQQRNDNSVTTAPAVSQEEARKDQIAKNDTKSPANNRKGDSKPSNAGTSTSSGSLPETGPADSLFTIVAASSMTAVLVSYIQSSRQYKFASSKR